MKHLQLHLQFYSHRTKVQLQSIGILGHNFYAWLWMLKSEMYTVPADSNVLLINESQLILFSSHTPCEVPLMVIVTTMSSISLSLAFLSSYSTLFLSPVQHSNSVREKGSTNAFRLFSWFAWKILPLGLLWSYKSNAKANKSQLSWSEAIWQQERRQQQVKWISECPGVLKIA